MNLYDEFSAIVTAFKRKKLRFAVVGGLAMAFHDEPRFTSTSTCFCIRKTRRNCPGS